MTERGMAAGCAPRPVRGRGPASPRAPRAGRDPRGGARVRLGLDRRPRGLPQPHARLAGRPELRGGGDAARADRARACTSSRSGIPRSPPSWSPPGRLVQWPRRLRCRRRRRVPKEFEAAGVPLRERGARVDEGIAVCRALWGPSPASFEGRFTRFTDVVLEPKPAQRGGPPIWIGGRSEAALRRAARLGTQVSYLVTPERFRAGMQKIEAFAADAGRPIDPGPLRARPRALHGRRRATASAALMRWRRATSARQYKQPFDDLARKYCLLGPPAACVDRLAEFVAAGVADVRRLFHRAARPDAGAARSLRGRRPGPGAGLDRPERARRPAHGRPDRGRAGRPRPRPRGRGRDLHALRGPRPADLRRLPSPRHPGDRRPPRAGGGARRGRGGRGSPGGSAWPWSCPGPASPTP